MLVRSKRGWELPESAAAPETVYLSRRSLARALAGGSILLAGAGLRPKSARAEEADPTADLYPAQRNAAFDPGRTIDDEHLVTTYNNYYEFGSQKEIWRAAQDLPVRPWTVTFDGMVAAEKTVDIDTLIRAMPLEERVYRHRCVEAWSITVPFTGFPMKALVDYAQPLGSAKYVRTETFMNPDVAGGQRQVWYPWPYIEGVTMAEATNELAFMVTGLYGHPLPKQNGAPLRIELPWKYGFKSGKGLVRFTFTDERPVGFWQDIQGSEYGFWANVNPEVPHPRWSQASERLLTTGEMVPTQIYNGYGDQVAAIYQGLEDEPLFM